MKREGVLKHKELFDAWLNEADIEYRPNSESDWCQVQNPQFEVKHEYRVVPAITELEVGKQYELKYTNQFCSTASSGNSTNMRGFKSNLPYTYVGKVKLPNPNCSVSLERYIFVSKVNLILYYVMFAAKNLDFVVSKLD